MTITNNRDIIAKLEQELAHITLSEALDAADLETGDYMMEFHHVGAAATTWLRTRRHPEYRTVEPLPGMKVQRLFWNDLVHQQVTNQPKTIMVQGRPMEVRDSLRGRASADRWVPVADLDNPDRFTGRFKVLSQAHGNEES